MNIRLLHFLGVMVLIPNLGHAADETLCKQKVKVFFGNGVWNSIGDTQGSARLLARKFDIKILGTDLEGEISYDIAHNPSDGVLLDLLETFQQNYTEDVSKFWRFMSGLDPLPDFLQEKFKQVAIEMDENMIRGNPSIQRHIEKYNKALIEGNKVVVVAHSQGNLFANISYSGIDPILQSGFGIVAVATPSGRVAAGGPYTTIDEDIIIASVYGSKNANLDNFEGINLDDLSGHTFATSYMMTNHPAEQKILNDILSTIEELPDLESELGSGPISASLTWGAQPDLDLHIYEPNGDHVYYRNLTGTSGSLDLDDTNRQGPEHYFVTCDKLEIGTYRFGVNYYRGDEIEQGTILLQAGGQVYPRSNLYGAARGSAGNDSPKMVFDVIVTGSEEEGYQFDVQ